jgi:hypothetical protein
MRLYQNWRFIIKKAWSIRFILIAGVFSGAEAILPMFSYAIPHKLFAILTFVAVAGAFISRIVAQEGV